MPKFVKLALTALIGGILLAMWWTHYGNAWGGLSRIEPWWLAWALVLLLASLALQWVRTSLLMGNGNWTPILAPVVLSHGVNVLAPSLLGDLLEIGALNRILNRPSRAILTRLVFRFLTTVSALCMLAGVAMGVLHPNVGFGVIAAAAVLPFFADQTTAWWSQYVAIPGTAPIEPMDPLGITTTATHTFLSWVQHAFSAASVFLLGAAINEAVSPATAAGMLSLADLATYLPVPLAGVGIHHWSVSSVAELMGSMPTGLVLINHAILVLVGGVCAITGWWLIPDKSLLTRQNG